MRKPLRKPRYLFYLLIFHHDATFLFQSFVHAACLCKRFSLIFKKKFFWWIFFRLASHHKTWRFSILCADVWVNVCISYAGISKHMYFNSSVFKYRKGIIVMFGQCKSQAHKISCVYISLCTYLNVYTVPYIFPYIPSDLLKTLRINS